jgi:hypothetical protein
LDRLKACPAQDVGVSRELFLKSWEELKVNEPILPVMAALVLHDDTFERLLLPLERSQLRASVNLALERYNQKINPPNKLGRLLVGIIKK